MFSVYKFGKTEREREMFDFIEQQYGKASSALETLLRTKRFIGKAVRYDVLLSDADIDDALKTMARKKDGEKYWNDIPVVDVSWTYGLDLQAALLKRYKKSGDLKTFIWVKESVTRFFNDVYPIVYGSINLNASDCLHRVLFFMSYDACFAELRGSIGENGYGEEVKVDVIHCLTGLCSFGMSAVTDVSSQYYIALALVYASAYFQRNEECSKILLDAGVAAARELTRYYGEVGSEEQQDEARLRLREIEGFIETNGMGGKEKCA